MKKKYLFLLCLAIFTFGNVFAQKGKSAPQKGHELIFNIRIPRTTSSIWSSITMKN